MNVKQKLFVLLSLDLLFLLFEINGLSISYGEADMLYNHHTFLSFIVKFSTEFFGNNDFALRIPMVLLHFGSVLLLYLISKEYIKQESYRLIFVLLFVFLPGVLSSAIVVNIAGLLIFGILLYIYLSQKHYDVLANLLLLVFLGVDRGFGLLYLGLCLYFLFSKKDIYLFVYTLILYIFSIHIYGFNAHGMPTGHFLDIIGVYSAILTPVIFIYLIYVLYRRAISKEIDEIWYISSVAILLSFVLSFRQRVAVEYFAPYLIVALPLVAQTFISSYRVRLKIYRKRYKIAFWVSLGFIFINLAVVLCNKELYLFLSNPKKHFVYDMNIAKEVAQQLKSKSVICVATDSEMQLRLKFYGIGQCDKYILKELDLHSKQLPSVTISYKNKPLYKAVVTKLNNR